MSRTGSSITLPKSIILVLFAHSKSSGEKQTSNAKKEKSTSTSSTANGNRQPETTTEVSKIHASASAHSLSSPAVPSVTGGTPVRADTDGNNSTNNTEDVRETPC